MGRKVIDRTGEEGYNNFGSKMIIREYRKYSDIDVYFPEYNWTFKHATYNSFKNREIKCPYELREYNIGYTGEGKYKKSKNGKLTKCYIAWHNMLMRCYDIKYQEKYPTYKGTEVCKEWLNFQNFAKWYYEYYYEVENDRVELDKDILVKGNKLYSPETCVFVPRRINTLFTKRTNDRGSLFIGVTPDAHHKKFIAYCDNLEGNQIRLGLFEREIDAFLCYKQYKENVMKKIIDIYEGIIPEHTFYKLKEAMYNYEVEITD